MSATAQTDKDLWILRVFGLQAPTAAPPAGQAEAEAADGAAEDLGADADVPVSEPAGGTDTGRSDQARAAWTGTTSKAIAAAAGFRAELARDKPADAEGLQNVLTSYAYEVVDALRSLKGSPEDLSSIRKLMHDLSAEMGADSLLDFLEKQGVGVRPIFLAGFDEVEAVLSGAT